MEKTTYSAVLGTKTGVTKLQLLIVGNVQYPFITLNPSNEEATFFQSTMMQRFLKTT